MRSISPDNEKEYPSMLKSLLASMAVILQEKCDYFMERP